MSTTRFDGRICNQIRPIKFSFDTFGYAQSSVFFELGNTKVLTSITLQHNVPPFLKGQRVGWLSAEYAMIPCATQQRTTRESSQVYRNSRNVEISRLIGRCLRTCINFECLGERTILIDCDVLQADGSTRVAAITAASLALELAVMRWAQNNIVSGGIFKHSIAAVSVGMINGVAHLDLCYEEDSKADADFNVIMTKNGDIVEIQGTAEKKAVSWKEFEELKSLAQKGIAEIFSYTQHKFDDIAISPSDFAKKPQQKASLFSLGNRFQKA